MATDQPPKKTERSHAENQERAYIAASRRADRSIEARVQSARMASEIHKKRTGKAFHISEEIVIKEEMYEEEEDDFPRSYRLLGPRMQTSSPEMNSRVETYLTNRVAMSKLMSATEQDWRDNAVNRAFAEMFPNANQQAQSLSHRWSTPGLNMPMQQSGRLQNPQDSAMDANFQSINYGQRNSYEERSHSFSGVSPSELGNDAGISSPSLTPGSGSQLETPQSQSTSGFADFMPSNLMEYGTNGSAFTSELPAEAKMMMGDMDMNGSFSSNPYPQDWMSGNEQMYTYPDMPKHIKQENGQVGQDLDVHSNLFDDSLGQMDWDASAQPNTGEEPPWDAFLNDNAWTTDQQ